ncbi:MAG: uracil-DNA glycosylase, partial [Elusimicrobia bacterium]|nr:uracil-DNA glycosylase [Elusimicrobiota bacterium]
MKNNLQSLTRELANYIRSQDEEAFARKKTSSKQPAAAQTNSKAELLQKLSEEVSSCKKCPLGISRIKPAFGVGNINTEIMFVGEGPGYEEDHRGEPFVGRAGQLLDKIISAMGLKRESIYIANIVKCHPMINPSDPEMRGNDRPPSHEEMAV